MRCVQHYSMTLWMLLLGMIIVTCFPVQSLASIYALKDIKVAKQNGNWRVVLTVTGSINYRTVKINDPLRVVVDLPNTANEITTITSTVANEIIGTIETATIISEPQPLTRVEINLKKDVPYETTQVGEQIWVSFKMGQVATPGPPKEQTTRSSHAVKKGILPPAKKLLAIQWVASEEKIDFDIICDGRVVKYNDFVLPDPPRLVVDVFGIQSTDTKANLEPNGPWVKRIRLGLHRDRARIVFDLGDISKAGVPYQVVLRNDGLEVSFKRPPATQ